jgi:hypothetical protein
MNGDVLALLADALTGTKEGAGPLCDALKEAGHEDAGNKLARLLALPGQLVKRLNEHRYAVHLVGDRELDWDGAIDLGHEQGCVAACEEVLDRLGEAIPPEPQWRPACEWCEEVESDGDDGLCRDCRSKGDEASEWGHF